MSQDSYSYSNCKNDHSKYLTVDEFRMQHLPEQFRTDDCQAFIKNAIDRTTRVVTSFTSWNRPDTFPGSNSPFPFSEFRGCSRRIRTGTGYVRGIFRNTSLVKQNEPCACWKCQRSGKSEEYNFYFRLSTASHVIFDDQEAQKSRFELFYNTSDRECVQYLYGVKVFKVGDQTGISTDTCVVCCVTHDPVLAHRLETIVTEFPKGIDDLPLRHLPVLISHPDGCKKRISIGNFGQVKLIYDFSIQPIVITLDEK